jgi:hypothetical protein
MFKIIKTVKKGDYLYAVVPDHPKANKNKYVLYHRVLVENSIGRLLTNDEIVHHIDEDKTNNDLDNLQILSRKDHAKLHAKIGRAYVQLQCVHCGIIFEREKRNVKGKGLCSRSCNAKYNRANSSWIGKQKPL